VTERPSNHGTEHLCEETKHLEFSTPGEQAKLDSNTTVHELFVYREEPINLSKQRRRREKKEKALLAMKNEAIEEMLDPNMEPRVLEEKAFESLLQPLNLSIYHVSCSIHVVTMSRIRGVLLSTLIRSIPTVTGKVLEDHGGMACPRLFSDMLFDSFPAPI
jgi:hypothetical protein